MNLDVLLENDPGKDDISLHPGLVKAINSLLGVRANSDSVDKDKAVIFTDENVKVVRKSFDGRRKKSGQSKFVYTVDVNLTIGECRKLRIRSLKGRVEPLLDSNENFKDGSFLASNDSTYFSLLRFFFMTDPFDE